MDRYTEAVAPEKKEAYVALSSEIRALRSRLDVLKQAKVQLPRFARSDVDGLISSSSFAQNPSYEQAITELLDDLRPEYWQDGGDDAFRAEGARLVDDDLKAHLAVTREGIVLEISQTEEKIKTLKEEVEQVWEEDKELEYELASVFMHRGVSQPHP